MSPAGSKTLEGTGEPQGHRCGGPAPREGGPGREGGGAWPGLDGTALGLRGGQSVAPSQGLGGHVGRAASAGTSGHGTFSVAP